MMNPRSVSNKLPRNPRPILMKWAEMVQTTETDVLIPEIRKKRKAAVVPKEEAFSDEELEESDVANDDELKALQVRPSTIFLLLQFTTMARPRFGRLDPSK